MVLTIALNGINDFTEPKATVHNLIKIDWIGHLELMQKETTHYDHEIAVIGGGAAGVMAYLRAVLNCDHTVLFQGDADTKRRGLRL